MSLKKKNLLRFFATLGGITVGGVYTLLVGARSGAYIQAAQAETWVDQTVHPLAVLFDQAAVLAAVGLVCVLLGMIAIIPMWIDQRDDDQMGIWAKMR